MNYGFSLQTTDPEEFEERIAPLAGSCRVRPAKGGKFDITVRAVRMEKLSLFVVKAPTLKVRIPPPHDYFCLNFPLGMPFSAIESKRSVQFYDDVHLVTPHRHLDIEACNGARVLAVKLNTEYVNDHALKLSGSRGLFTSAKIYRLAHSVAEYGALTRSVARLWSALQRNNTSLGSLITSAEREDGVFTQFVLALQEEKKTCCRPGERTDKTKLTRAEEYLCAHLTHPVSRAELAAAAGVSIRTLSRGFAKRWGTGPMGFLKTRRMEAAYRDLLGADPSVTSVTEIATKYGFTHLGKFAGEYKCTFLESPSETLRQ